MSQVEVFRSKKDEDPRFMGYGPSVNGRVFAATTFTVRDLTTEMHAVLFSTGDLPGDYDAVFAAAELGELMKEAFGNRPPQVAFIDTHLAARLNAIPSGGEMAFGAALTRAGIKTFFWPDASVPSFDHWLVSERDPAKTPACYQLGTRVKLMRNETGRSGNRQHNQLVVVED